MTDFKDQFSEGADDYAAYRPRYPAALADFLAGMGAQRELAWEAGCGSGQLSVLLAERFDRVIATDASAEQLSEAKPHPRIEYRVARAEASGLPDGVADLAVAAQAAHWFDLPAYYAEVRRVARPGAVVALVVYGVHTAGDERIDGIVRRFYGETLGRYWSPDRRHVEAGYQSLAFPFPEIEWPKLEMRMDWSLANMIGYVETWSATRSLIKAEGRGPVDAFSRELAAAWGPPESARTVRWPLSVRAGHVSTSDAQ